MKNNRFSREITVFHGRSAPETGKGAGYAAIIEALKLPVPLPSTLALIGNKTAIMKKMAGKQLYKTQTFKKGLLLQMYVWTKNQE